MLRLGQPKSKIEFSGGDFLPFHALARQEDRGFHSRLNLLGVTQTVFFMVPESEETQTSTSSTTA